MAHIIEDRVMETSTTTGTGSFTLAGAVTGFVAFDDVMADADTCYYLIEGVNGSGVPTGEWETGLATFNDTDTLVRTSVIRSSNANAAVNFSAGTKRVSLQRVARTFGEGTAFPSSPRTDERFFRTDRGIEYFYDGTRWLSTQLHVLQVTQRDTAQPQPMTSSGAAVNRVANPWSGVYDIYLLDYVMSGVMTTGSTGTNYFTSRLSQSAAAVDTNLGSGLSNQSDTQNSHVSHREAINTVVTSSVQNFAAIFTKVGGGSATYYVTTAVTYRLIG